MAIATARVSPRNQLSLPRAVRRALGIEPGDTVLFIVEGDNVRLVRRPSDLSAYTYGLGKEDWARLGGGDAFLREERAAWEE
ncbi:MAG TPA: AbrB/MazE/SpoVT family DNA-binding domain-containing protein [Anaerolineae bacterium]|nr:AbrB/MazE/SpoVT family DNA-binding domain-containing protein [Anaerolineae bacterium]HPL30189.1 AbrB/MazE/SpoVT family DNA-binding domain-containing protein [Anaerolineae bacterium]